jgi:hypothetical protein
MDELKSLQRRIAKEQAQGHGKSGKPYSEALRRDVSKYLQAATANGRSPNQLAPELGLSAPTAYQWCTKQPGRGRKKKPQAFRQMSIVAQPSSSIGKSVGASSRIVVKGPGGLRAVGLAVADLAELLRRLGC